MKKSLLAVFLLLALSLSAGCSSIVDGSYTYERKHQESGSTEAAAGDIGVSNYEDLKTAIYNFARDGVRRGTIKFYYNGDDTNEVISKAIQEVKLNTPVGAYAVDLISPKTTRIVSYYEIDLTITYLKTRAQMNKVQDVQTKNGVNELIADSLRLGNDELVMQSSIGSLSEEYILTEVESAYYSNPLYAIEHPEVTVTFYPESGITRIVEVLFNYTDSAVARDQMQQIVASECSGLISGISLTEDSGENARSLCAALARHSECVQTAEDVLYNGAYGPLRLNIGTSEGYALTYKLLCDSVGIECQVVKGRLDNEEHFWNIIYIGDRYYHVDAFACDEAGYNSVFMASDSDMLGAYWWDTELYPTCE